MEVLSAEKKCGRKDRAPFLVCKVSGTRMIMVHYHLNIAQDYNVPGFQFERIMTGKPVDDRHEVGFVEHVQIMKVGGSNVLMTAEVDAVDQEGCPVEVKLMKQGVGGTKVFFQMVGSGSLTLYRGTNQNGVLKSVRVFRLEEMAQQLRQNNDVESLQANLLRNMEKLKEWDRHGRFDGGKVYRIDFNPQMEPHLVPPHNHPLLPPESVIRELLHLNG